MQGNCAAARLRLDITTIILPPPDRHDAIEWVDAPDLEVAAGLISRDFAVVVVLTS